MKAISLLQEMENCVMLLCRDDRPTGLRLERAPATSAVPALL